MRPIMLFRAAHLALYTEVLREIGTPVERELATAGLPTMLAEQPDSYVPLLLTIDFLRKMEQKEGIEDLGFLAAQRLALSGLGADLRIAAHRAPTLYAGLQLFCRLARFENPNFRFFIVPKGDGIQVCSELVGYHEFDGLQYSEWLQNFAAVTIVRQFAGPRWCPAEIAFKSRFSPSPHALERFSNTRVLTGMKTAWIEVPASMLSLPPRINRRDPGSYAASNGKGQLPVQPILDFPGSLKLALRAYLGDGNPSVNLAAVIAGISVRTLQRCLAQYGLSYSNLVQQVRFETAAQLLGDPERKVIDVAYAVGYGDPSHFSRAFRRLAGVSPREFRRDLAIHCDLPPRTIPLFKLDRTPMEGKADTAVASM